MIQMYSTAKDDTVLSWPKSVKNGTQGHGDVPYIDVVATRSTNKRTITLFCVNRSLTNDTPVKIDLGAFAATKTAKVEQITAVSRYVINDKVEPKRVVPQLSSLNVTPNKPLTITLPHEGVTVILLKKNEAGARTSTIESGSGFRFRGVGARRWPSKEGLWCHSGSDSR